MLYRNFPKIPDTNVSSLGFGLMHVPVKNGDNNCIDVEQMHSLIHAAVENGITYFDTAYWYHGGNNERIVGDVLKNTSLRNKVYIADKCPMNRINETKDFEYILTEQLQRLQTDHIDFYLLHAMNASYWEKIKECGGLEFFEKAKRQGRIRYLGFSFNDSLPVFKTIIDEYDAWEFTQIHLNYVDTDYQAGLSGLEYAAQKGVGVIAMKPLRGGLLAHVAAPVKKIFSSAETPRIPSEWALRWLWERQEISCVLSDMRHFDEIIVNSASAAASRPNSLPRRQLAVIEEAATWYKNHMTESCP